MMNLEELFADREMALDRAALPALTSQARLRLEGRRLDDLRGVAIEMGRASGRAAYQLLGATAVVQMSGLITSDPFLRWLTDGTSPDLLVRDLRAAVEDPASSHVLLLVNSPGGETSLLQEAAADIRALRGRKPITAMARTLMASAAFWLGAQADEVLATPSARVGSVGVYLTHYDLSRLNERVGITPTYITSDPAKIEGNPDEPLGDPARRFLQAQIDQTYATFVRDLAAGRRTSEAVIRQHYGAGRAFGAAEAQRRGLVDRVASLDAVLAEASRPGTTGRSPVRPGGALSAEQQIRDEHAAIAAVLAASE